MADRQHFQRNLGGRPVDIFTLRHDGHEVQITNYGGIIVSWLAPDRDGNLADIVLGCDSLDGYLAGHPYLGCIVGRYANRIREGRFTLDGADIQLARNYQGNNLHGGVLGWDKVVWLASEEPDHPAGPSLILQHFDPEGHEGFPGAVTVMVRYTLLANGQLDFVIRATTTAPTVVSSTNHSYFNLAGADGRTALDHTIQIPAEAYTPGDKFGLPDGTVIPVAGTDFDLRDSQLLKEVVERPAMAGRFGLDDNFVLRPFEQSTPSTPQLAVTLSHPESGRQLTCWTTAPCVQAYAGNTLDSTVIGKGGCTYPPYSGVAIEPQLCPDSPNHPQFPTTELRPGETYVQHSSYRCGIIE